MIFVILALALASIYLVLVTNRKYLGLAYSQEKNLLTNSANLRLKKKFAGNSFFVFVGTVCANIIPAQFLDRLEKDVAFLGRSGDYLYLTIGQAFSFWFVLLMLYFFSHNPLMLVLANFLLVGLFAEIPLSVQKNKAIIDDSVNHTVACLRVLVVNTETPLVNALSTIIKDMPAYMAPMKLELERILAKAEKANMREALRLWQSDSSNFKDFISLLVSINEGASRSAIKSFIDRYLRKSYEERQEQIKAKAENLQVILMGPVILIFLVVLQPMVSAINYIMSTGF